MEISSAVYRDQFFWLRILPTAAASSWNPAFCRACCVNCGRCCKKLKPTLSQQDQRRLADRLEMTVEQLRERYLEYDKSDDEPEWQMKGTPCPFQEDNKCSVYEDRPQDCRGYPYLHEPGFNGRTMGMIERTFTCPIVFNVMEGLKEKVAFDDDVEYDCW